MILRNIRGMEFRQDGYLLYNVLNLIFRVLNVDDLDRYRLSSASVDTMKGLVCLRSSISGSYLPFVYLPEAATAYRSVSTLGKKSCMPDLPMQFCFVYRVSGSTEPPVTVPA